MIKHSIIEVVSRPFELNIKLDHQINGIFKCTIELKIVVYHWDIISLIGQFHETHQKHDVNAKVVFPNIIFNQVCN